MSAGLKIDLDIREFDGQEWVSLTAYRELQTEKMGLDTDISQLRKNGHVTDTELAENRRINADNIQMKADLDEIHMFIRQHYQEEIQLGQHAAFKSTAECVKFYMGRERTLSRSAGK